MDSTTDERQSHLGKPLAATAWFGQGDTARRVGRKPKRRMLSEMLQRSGGTTIAQVSGKKISRRKLLAEMLWQAVTEGKVTLSDGRTLYANMTEWTEVVKFIYNQLDGPPRADVDVTSNGESIVPSGSINMNIEQMFGAVMFIVQQNTPAAPPIPETPVEGQILDSTATSEPA